MGSPLSPILTDIVMDDLETEQVTKLGFEIPLYFRYVVYPHVVIWMGMSQGPD